MEVILRMIYSGLFKRFNNFAVIGPSEFFFPLDSKASLDTVSGKGNGTNSKMEMNTGASEAKWTSSQL